MFQHGNVGPGVVANACNLSTLGGWGRQIAWAQKFETSLGNLMKLRLYKKYKKLAGCGSVRLLSQLFRRLREDDGLNLGGEGCSEPRWCHCTTACMIEPDFDSRKKNEKEGQVPWLIPVILELWEAEVGRSPEVRSLKLACPIWWKPISTKNTKN